MYDEARIEELQEIYRSIEGDIRKRLQEFKKIWEEGDDKKIFMELAFCLLTPQSKARICWRAVERLTEKDVLFQGSEREILEELGGVRFKERKALYIVEARKKFVDGGDIRIKGQLKRLLNNGVFLTREWLVESIKGLGYKEASHFLRNIGFGEDIAILDRHVLKNLRSLGVIGEFPKSLSKRKYLTIENDVRKFSKHVKIPLDHLDLILWYRETGEIFK